MAARVSTGDVAFLAGAAGGPYAFRDDPSPGKLETWAQRLAAPLRVHSNSYAVLSRILTHVHRHNDAFVNCDDAGLRAAATELRYDLKAQGMAEAAVGKTFALVREVAGRKLGMLHFDVQLVGGWAMLNGMIAEMETGEGKTLTATLPACAAAMAGIPTHVITVNDYLAGRDAEIMRPIYEALGLTLGVALADMSDAERKAAYDCDVTYTTNKQVAFDHLRDRIQLRGKHSRMSMDFLEEGRGELLLRGLYFAIIDEADSVLVDEAVTPLIISRRGKPQFEREMLADALEAAACLEDDVHFRLNRSERRLKLLPAGETWLADWADERAGLWHNTRYRRELVSQALKALYLFDSDQHYLVDEGLVKIIDEFTGRVMEGRSWEQGLHQLIEVKEGCEITGEMETMGRISYQRFFRRYLMLGGMSGTVNEVAGELRDLYGTEVATIPTNRRNCRQRYRGRLHASEDEKWSYVVERIRAIHTEGRPVLVGTRSVVASEHLSELLTHEGLSHEVLNARRDKYEATIVAEAGVRGRITVATNMAGRGTDIKLGDGVTDIGGLHVIATERHEARRIDRQLFGRCARQGDPGSYEEIAALEDQLVHIHLSDSLKRVAQKLLESGSRLGELGAMMLVARAQMKAQGRSGRRRVQMQKMDEYLSNVLAFTGRLE